MKWIASLFVYACLIGQAVSLPLPNAPASGLAVKARSGESRQVIWMEHARPSPKWVKDAVIYEVYPRSFSKNESFFSIIKKLPEIKKLGVTVIWVMPVHPIGMLHRKGPLGSPYSIRNYYAINPEYGTLADFEKLVRAVHAAGLHILMDAVLNHTAWDNPLIKEHPEWYKHDSTGKIISPNPDWTDVAQLNYANQHLRRYMINMLKYWVKDVGVDGFRCDAAEMVPLSFWVEARAALDSIKPVMMLAEGAKPDLQLKAFDLTYSWNLYNALGRVFKGKAPAVSIDSTIVGERHIYPIGALRMRFNTNHDENAYDAPSIERYGPAGDSLTVALIATLPSVPLIYNGDEVGNPKRLSLFKQVLINWNVKNGFRALYDKIYSIRRSNPEFVTGTYEPLVSNGGGNVVAYERKSGARMAVCVFNFSRSRKNKVAIDVPGIGDSKLVDEVTGRAYKAHDGKLEFHMRAYDFKILLAR